MTKYLIEGHCYLKYTMHIINMFYIYKVFYGIIFKSKYYHVLNCINFKIKIYIHDYVENVLNDVRDFFCKIGPIAYNYTNVLYHKQFSILFLSLLSVYNIYSSLVTSCSCFLRIFVQCRFL